MGGTEGSRAVTGRLMELRREERKFDLGWQIMRVVGNDWYVRT